MTSMTAMIGDERRRYGLKPGDPVFGYIRVSTAREEMISPELQRERIESYCKRHGLRLTEVVEDLDISGRSFAKRKVADIIARVGRGEARGVVVLNVSRWGRNVRSSLQHVHELREVGGHIASTSENLDDPDSPFGRFNLTQLFAIAQLQSDQISSGWKQVQERRRRLGLAHNSGAKLGYIWDRNAEFVPLDGSPMMRGIHVPDDNAAHLAYAYEEFVAGRPTRDICRQLDLRGATARSGQKIRHSALTSALDSGMGAGLLGTHMDPDTHREDTSQFWYYPGAHQAVISRELFEDYRARRKGRRARRPQLAKSMWTDVVVCGTCGKPLRRNVVGGRNQWRCFFYDPYMRMADQICGGPTQMYQHVIQNAVVEWLTEQAKPGVAAQWGDAEADAQAYAVRVQGVERAIDAKAGEVKRLARLMGEGRLPDDVGAELIVEARAALDRLEIERAGLRAAQHSPPPPPSDLDALRELIMSPGVDQLEAGKALRVMLARVEVHKPRTPRPEGGLYNLSNRVRVIPRWAAHLVVPSADVEQ